MRRNPAHQTVVRFFACFSRARSVPLSARRPRRQSRRTLACITRAAFRRQGDPDKGRRCRVRRSRRPPGRRGRAGPCQRLRAGHGPVHRPHPDHRQSEDGVFCRASSPARRSSRSSRSPDLQEGVITRDTMIRVGRRRYMDLTEAMAHSNNVFFEEVGTPPGIRPASSICALARSGRARGLQHSGRAARACCRGRRRCLAAWRACPVLAKEFASRRCSSPRWSPLLANGGTQYYLQYPRTEADAPEFRAACTPAARYRTFFPDCAKACWRR